MRAASALIMVKSIFSDGVVIAGQMHNAGLQSFLAKLGGETHFLPDFQFLELFTIDAVSVKINLVTLRGFDKEVTNDILIAGDSVNADEVVARQDLHQVNARAVGECFLLEIPVSWMREHLTNFDHMAEKLLASLAKLTTMSASQMVACYLQKLCVLYNFDPRGFELPYTKSLIASRMRIEKETFSRTLQTLHEQGITVSGTHVSIMDMRKAGNFACGECSVAEECGTHRLLHAELDKQAGYGT